MSWLVPPATERIRFRGWTGDDLEPLTGLYHDPVTAHFFGPTTSADVWRRIAMFIGHQHLRGFSVWALETRKTSEFIGYAGIWRPEGWDVPDLGYGLTASHRGQGLAIEAARAVRDYAYGLLKLEKLVSYILPTNQTSIGVATRLGARRQTANFTIMDKLHDVYLHTHGNT